GPALVKAPFPSAEIEIWKEVAKGYRDDPLKVAKRFEFIIKNQNPDWEDVDMLLGEMSETERQMILNTARVQVQAQIISGVLHGTTVEQEIPMDNPNWNPNIPQHYERLRKYREWVKYSFELAIPKSINYSVLYEMKQGPRETPTEFLD
ncbi:hypothetical protein N330_13710, partial [Leptosomus discolor]